MPSVVGLLEQRELAARRRVDELREEADRIHAELAVAEQEWNEWVIARSRANPAGAGAGGCAGDLADLADAYFAAGAAAEPGPCTAGGRPSATN